MNHQITRAAAGAQPATMTPAAAAARSWSILLTSTNHGTVGPLGSTFPHAGEKHERVQVMEIVEAGAAPAPGTDLAGLVRFTIDGNVIPLDTSLVPAAESTVLTDERINELWDETPTADAETLNEVRRRFARSIEREVAAQAGQVAVPEWRGIKAVLTNLIAVASVRIVDKDEEDDQLIADTSEAVRQLDARLATAPSSPAVAQQAPADWISVDERLPEGRYCLATYRDRAGKLRIIRAMYVRQFEIEASGDECDSETNEANDIEYLKAGWYEMIDNWGEYSSVHVSEGPVTHWQPLPDLPGAQASTPGESHKGGAA